MDVVSDDILGLILKRVSNRKDRNSVSQVCKRWWRLEVLNRSSFRVLQPVFPRQFLHKFPNLVTFTSSIFSLSKDDLDFVAQTYPNLETIAFYLGYPCNPGKCDEVVEGLCTLATKCPKFSHLTLKEGNNIYEDVMVRFLTLAHNLKKLELRCCRWVTDQSLKAIGSSSCLKTIKILVLDRCGRISDSGFSHLQKMCVLEELDLSFCSDITDRTLEILANGSISKTMKKLNFTCCLKITDSGVSFLRNMCVLEELVLSHCFNVTGRGLGFPSKTIKKLGLNGCYITDDGPSGLREMCALEELKN